MKILNKKTICITLIINFLWGCSTTTPSSVRAKAVDHKADDAALLPETVFIKPVNSTDPAPFFGLLKTDAGRTGTSVMYQGGAGLAGLFAQVLAHAAIENQVQNEALQKAQQQADEVLTHYTDLISRNTSSLLVENSVETLNLSTPKVSIITSLPNEIDDSELIIESLPIYYMSQDQKTILLEHQLKAYYPAEPDNNIYQNMAKIISGKQDVQADNNSWTKDNGEIFFKTTADLHQISLNILLKDMYRDLKSQGKAVTHKYYIGEEKYYARGKILHEQCDYKVIRDLKGNILIIQFDNSNEQQSDTCISDNQDHSKA